MELESIRSEIEVRAALASRALPLVDALSLLLKHLGEKAIGPDDYARFGQVDMILAELQNICSELAAINCEDLGPRVPPAGQMGSHWIFANFSSGAVKLQNLVRYLVIDRRRHGNADWSKWLREYHDLRQSYRNLSTYLVRLDQLGIEWSFTAHKALTGPVTGVLAELSTRKPAAPQLKQEDNQLLKAAVRCGAVCGVCVATKDIAKEAFGVETDLRNPRERLSEAGYIVASSGAGITVTDAGVEHLKRMQAIAEQFPRRIDASRAQVEQK